MTPTIKQYFAIVSLVFICLSCEKVIDLKLNSTSKKFVIEANLTDTAGSAIVRISQTKNFNDSNYFNGIGGAVVNITDAAGIIYSFVEGAKGIYTNKALIGKVGASYTLQVQASGNTFTAQSTMPAKVTIDSLYTTYSQLIGGVQKVANVDYKDPENFGNSYRIIPIKNEVRYQQLYVGNDDYINNKKVNTILYFYYSDAEKEKRLNKGDTLKVELQCIPKDMYTYWYSLLRSATGSQEQATPTNPVSNITGGALGYFSTHTIDTETIIVQ